MSLIINSHIHPFDVLSFSPFGWFDSSDASSITESGGLVSQQNDLSGTGNHMAQAAGGQQPTTNANTQNGLNIIDYDGIDNTLTNGSVTIPSSGDVTLLIAGKITAGFGAVDAFISGDATNDFQYVGEAANNFRSRLSGPDGNTTAAASDQIVPSVHALIFDFTGASTYKVQVNGVDINSGIAYTTKLDTSLDMKFAANRGGGAFLPCSYFESIWIPTAEAGEIAAITGYLINKWAL